MTGDEEPPPGGWASLAACLAAVNLPPGDYDDPSDWDASWERRRQIIRERDGGEAGRVPPPLWYLWRRPVQVPGLE